MASKTPRGRGFPLRCLQEHPEGVLLGFSPPNLEPGLRAKKRVSQFGLPHPVEPQPSQGESISFLSPAQAAGLLLSVMRQKVGKERSQGVFAPLAIPPRLGSESPTEKIRPCAHPPEAALRPGRQGRRCKASRQAHPKARPRSPYEGRRHHPYGPDCCSKTAISDRAPLRRPPRRAQLRCCSAGYGAFSEKEPRPTVSGRAPGKFFRFNSSLKRYISLLRRGARGSANHFGAVQIGRPQGFQPILLSQNG